jgi:hypothetical protein
MAGRSMNTSGPTLQAPVWAADYGSRDHLVPGGGKIDPAQFAGDVGTFAVVGAAGAAIDATTVPVAALTAAIPSGVTLDFGGKKFARLTAAAAKGATSLTVSALATALVSGDKAEYKGSDADVKRVLSGTLLGRTFTERDASTPFGPLAAGDEEVFILYHDIDDANTIADAELYRPGSIVKENFLPDFSGQSTAVKALVRGAYICTRGAE